MSAFAILPDGKLRIYGGDGEREQGQQDPPDDKQDQSEDQQDQADDAADGDDSDDDDKELLEKVDKSKEKTLEDQLDDEKRARRKAERALAKQAQDKQAAEADKDAVKDRDRYKAKVEARDKLLTENLLTWEINKQKKYDFIDVDDVIRAFHGDEVTIDLDADEPVVEGLDLALKRIAKEKPHFLKKAKEESDDDEPDQPSGSKSGNGKPESAEAEAKRLGEKFKIPGYTMQSVRPV